MAAGPYEQPRPSMPLADELRWHIAEPVKEGPAEGSAPAVEGREALTVAQLVADMQAAEILALETLLESTRLLVSVAIDELRRQERQIANLKRCIERRLFGENP